MNVRGLGPSTSAHFAMASGFALFTLAGLGAGLAVANESPVWVEAVAIVLVGAALVVGRTLGRELGQALLALTRAARDADTTQATSPLPLIEARAAFEAVAQLADRVEIMQREVRAARAGEEQASALAADLLRDALASENRVNTQFVANLHDGPAQTVGMLLSLSEQFGLNREGRELVAETHQELRNVMAMAQPPKFQDGGLAAAVQDLVLDLNNRYGLRVKVTWPNQSVALPGHYAQLIYRVAAEALINVVKHADVDEAELSLTIALAAPFRLVVRDRGEGFDPSEIMSDSLQRGHHLGLGLRRTQAAAAGGSLQVVSGKGAGTTVVLELPSAPPPRPPVPGAAVPQADSIPAAR